MREGDGRYFAWLYSTDAQKPLLGVLLEMESEIASGLRGDIDHHVAHARVQWWGEEVERCAEGRPVHPLTRELVRVHGGAASALAGVAGFVDTAVWDLASATFETRKELTAYCERWATAMFETAAAPVPELASPTPHSASTASDLVRGKAPSAIETPAAVPAAVEAAHAPHSSWKTLGAAVREIELLADLARDARVGRIRIPLDELDRAGVDTNALAKLPWPAPLSAFQRERHEALRATVAKCLSSIAREEQMAQRGLLVWVALTWRLSVRAQRALPSAIFPRRYDALADGWQAWRAARRAAAGNLRLS